MANFSLQRSQIGISIIAGFPSGVKSGPVAVVVGLVDYVPGDGLAGLLDVCAAAAVILGVVDDLGDGLERHCDRLAERLGVVDSDGLAVGGDLHWVVGHFGFLSCVALGLLPGRSITTISYFVLLCQITVGEG